MGKEKKRERGGLEREEERQRQTDRKKERVREKERTGHFSSLSSKTRISINIIINCYWIR